MPKINDKRTRKNFRVIANKKNLLSRLTFVSMFLGAVVGMLFGDDCRIFAPIGDFFIALMQASILPYLFFSILYNIGGLDGKSLRVIWEKIALTLVIFYLSYCICCFCVPYSFPNWLHSSFLSIDGTVSSKTHIPVEMFVSNPIMAMARNYVPALALFCLVSGFILQRTLNKQTTMEVLRISESVLRDFTRICNYIVPVCIFAIVANIIGCTSTAEFIQYQVFMVSYMGLVLFFFFVLFPLLLKAFYPFSYVDIYRYMRMPCLTAFFTGSSLITLPMTTEKTSELFEKYGFDKQEITRLSAILLPLFALFPYASRFFDSTFVSYVAWHVNTPLGEMNTAQLYAMTILTGFGSSKIAIPSLLKYFNLPQNMAGVFLSTEVLLYNPKTVANLLGQFCCSAICILMMKKIRPPKRTALLNFVLLLVLGVMFIFGLKVFWKLQDRTPGEKKIQAAMRVEDKVPWIVRRGLPATRRDENSSLLDQIIESRTLRVGVAPKVMPSCYLDANGNPTGLDVQLLQLLAGELDCEKIEYYIFSYEDMRKALNERRVDIMVGHLYVTQKRLSSILFSRPYLRVPLSFMARRSRIASLRDNPSQLLDDETSFAVINDDEIPMLRQRGIKGKIVNIHDYANFTGKEQDFMCISADVASAYCIQHQEFSYYVPEGMQQNVIAFALPPGEYSFAHFVDYWLVIMEQSGELLRNQRYWISGEKVIEAQKRWSILDEFAKDENAEATSFNQK